jgi:hypothetical protein
MVILIPRKRFLGSDPSRLQRPRCRMTQCTYIGKGIKHLSNFPIWSFVPVDPSQWHPLDPDTLERALKLDPAIEPHMSCLILQVNRRGWETRLTKALLLCLDIIQTWHHRSTILHCPSGRTIVCCIGCHAYLHRRVLVHGLSLSALYASLSRHVFANVWYSLSLHTS